MRGKPGIPWLLLLAVCQLAVSMTTPARAADKTDPSRSFELTYTLKLTDLPADGSPVAAWIPVPQANDWQVVRGYVIDSDAPATLVREDRYGNLFLQFDLTEQARSATGGALEVPVKFFVTRFKRQPLSRPGVTVDPDDLARWLQPDSLVPVSGKVAAEAQANTGGAADSLGQARALYDHIVATVRYDKPADKTGWGRGDAEWACDNRFGNCTDFHSMFIGQARSLSIPARFRMGIPLPLDKTSGEIGGYHCWAEFYLPDHGWVPVDASEAQKDQSRVDELFGSLDASRVDFTLGRDYEVPGTHHGPFNFLIYPYAEVNGIEHKGVGRAFSFKDIP